MAKQPEGEVPPITGELPALALADFESTPLAFYVHVPFCSSRCGYCDFNTYTAEELGGSSRQTWAATAIQEIELARKISGTKPISTIFIGGGTPTLLPAADIASVISTLKSSFGFEEGIEITIEANPDSVDLEKLVELRAAGVNRISFGMQSASVNVLRILERTHKQGSVEHAVADARTAGFENINVDLIYGTPTESIRDLQKTLDAVAALNVDHVSAYALIVEEGTRLARQIAQGAVAQPDDDDMAEKYELLDAFFESIGMSWYEVSNWSKPGKECHHNLHYWRTSNWWGIGPGAHSHIGGVRWWNAKHPNTWTEALNAGTSPAVGREVLTVADREFENVLLQIRLREGLHLGDALREIANEMVTEGLLAPIENDRAILTMRGRLLADAVVRRLMP